MVFSEPSSAEMCTCYGRTIVHLAAFKDHAKLAAFYLQMGMAVNHKDHLGKSALEIANENGAYTCERLMKRHVLRMTSFYDTGDGSLTKYQTRPASSKRKPVIKKTKLEPSLQLEHTSVRSEGYHSNDTSNEGSKENLDQQTFRSVNVSHSTSNANKRLGSANSFHTKCSTRKPFIVRRHVAPSEGKKLVTVEYTPLESPSTDTDYSSTRAKSVVVSPIPKSMTPQILLSSRGTHSAGEVELQSVGIAEEVIQQLLSEGNVEEGHKKKRRHSTKNYYKTKYHLAEEEVTYHARLSIFVAIYIEIMYVINTHNKYM